jgi:branched-chain amino acid transport system substrate-binding protein
MICSQAGIPVQAASKAFLEAYKAKFNQEPILYSPFTYDAANLLIAAMQKADSVDPAKYLPALASIQYKGASGNIRFDEKGDRKDAEMTIFTMQAGKLEPVAIVQSGKTVAFADYMKAQGEAEAPKAAESGMAAPAGAPAAEPAKPAEPAKDAAAK